MKNQNLVVNEEIINHLRYLIKSYDGITKLIAQSKQRLLIINPEAKPEHQIEIDLMEKIKGRFSRQIEKYLKYWPIWDSWLKGIPGAGPWICGKLILLFYYAFIPVCHLCGAPYPKGDIKKCEKCGKKSKGNGLLKYKVIRRDFPNISKWWAFLGRHNVNGKMPKRKKGEQANWSTPGRTTTFHLGEAFNKQSEDHPYKNYLLERKVYREKTHPSASKGHRHNMAKNETIKLFLSHFWHVARELEGLSTDGPYIQIVGGHTGIIPPYYWKD